MLVDAWKTFTDREYPKAACCFGAALSALIEAQELGSKTKGLVEDAVIASNGLYEKPSAATTRLVQRFLDEAGGMDETDPARACVVKIMKRVSNHKSADYQIRVLEGILRATPGRDRGRADASGRTTAPAEGRVVLRI